MKKLFALALTGALLVASLAGCAKKSDTLKVGASPAPHAEVLEIVKELLAKIGRAHV